MLEFLYRQDNDIVEFATRKDLANFTQRLRMEELAGRTPIQWLFDEISKNDNHIYFCKKDSNGRVEMLCIVPQSGLELWRRYPQLWMGDATYKTNRFNMPLFNLVGATPTKRTFQIAAVFMNGERKENFHWIFGKLLTLAEKEAICLPNLLITDREQALISALKAYQKFDKIPHILCQWHVYTNVLAKTKTHFPKAKREGGKVVRNETFSAFLSDFKSIMHCENESEYFKKKTAIQTEGKYPKEAINYLFATWLDKCDKKLVACYVNQHRHFGHTTTSIVEGMHATIKRSLKSSKGDLATVFKRLDHFWRHQEITIRNVITRNITRTMAFTHGDDDVLYSEIRQQITYVAINLINHEKGKLDRDISKWPEDNGPCKEFPCMVRLVYNLPCKHDIWQKLHNDKPIQLKEIDEFWHWVPGGMFNGVTYQLVRNPLNVKAKGRQKGALELENSNSTKRLPSAFEITEAIEKREAKDTQKNDNSINSLQKTSISIENTTQDWEANITVQPRSSQQYLNHHEWIEDIILPEDSDISDNEDDDIQFAIEEWANVQSLSDMLLAEAAK